ncbi:hypothetical protein BTR14_10075 [Rhizobium rhizosphaerae]|uniref:Uncharacterized protein n=1 Tax=Xaviernesmea rhizosphaerae TaxID=1672749 RepID=A0ABX3PFG8_9HYPH|nr:hypothetical protein BTR14_10075 [Xaviernesmea rhizosphaerae]
MAQRDWAPVLASVWQGLRPAGSGLKRLGPDEERCQPALAHGHLIQASIACFIPSASLSLF